MHKLLQLNALASFVIDSFSSTHFGRGQTDHPVGSSDFILDECVVVPVKILDILLVLWHLRVVNRKQLHEEVGGIGEFGHGSVNLAEVLR